MYLQSLEMIGFKSFALRTVLNFHRGVTAVVGPNGCGKSNVLDAVRWVLGEQSAKALRGGEMADVIFSGTDSRPALGMAEVSMTFAECEKELGVEWNEICVTRRVFRDGKSEYFLNKVPCRLREIHQLFMDTGVGRSAYSIMEQGKIDLILSSRPEDRRTIFEEAAGITKYKAQKKEALRKLEYTEANLLRVQDIIKEVRRQIGSLQRQAGKARRYQALMKDLGIFDTHLSHKNYCELARTGDEIRRELTRNDDQRATHETEVSQQESELSAFRARLEALDAQVSEIRDDLQALKSRIFSAEDRISTNMERSEEARSLIERHRREIAAAGEKMRVQQDEIVHTDELLARMVSTLRSHEASLGEQNQAVRVAREERTAVERHIQELGATTATLDARLGSLRNELSTAGGRREAAETRLRLLQGESEAAAQAAREFAARIMEIERRAQMAQLAAENAQTEQTEAQLAYEAAQENRQAAEAALNSISKEAASIESRVEVLRQLQEQGEGYDEGTQAVLRGLDNPDFFKPAIHGALGDHIQVDSRFIPAIEAALGAGLQAIVFKDTDVAELALQSLSERQLGKAAICPRDWIVESGDFPHGAQEAVDVMVSVDKAQRGGTALCQRVRLPGRADCAIADGEAGALASRLLHGVVIAENLEAAFRLKSANPGLGSRDTCRRVHQLGGHRARGTNRRQWPPIYARATCSNHSARSRASCGDTKVGILGRCAHQGD